MTGAEGWAGAVRATGAAGSPGADDERRAPALSPSRAADFKACPLLYRFRVVDRLPELPSAAQLRGTVVHTVLEGLLALPPAERDPARARTLADEVLGTLDPAERAVLTAADDDPHGRIGALLDAYFALEDPREVRAEAQELLVETESSAGTPLRGYLDRLDLVGDDGLVVVDYKTGASPRETAEVPALFGVKFYALMLLRLRGVVPRLRLLYLTDTASLTYVPDAAELARFERTLEALWAAIRRAAPTGDFRPSPGRCCSWCAHQERCPAFGGTPPAYPGWPDSIY